MVLEEVWAVDAHCTVIAVDPASGDVYSIKRVPSDGQMRSGLWRIDRRGRTVDVVPLERGIGRSLHVARLRDDGLAFVGLGERGIEAVDARGHSLWSYAVGDDALDDLCAADLDGDGHDEVILGFNGYGGLRVLNSDGTLRWRSNKVGNVWSVDCITAGVEGAPLIVAPWGDRVSLFDASGTMVRSTDTGIHGWSAHVTHPGPGAESQIVSVRGCPVWLAGLDIDGRVRWKASGQLDPRLSFWGFAAAADGPWIACTSPSSTRVYVYDVRDGSMAASVEAGVMPSVAWVPNSGDQSALLVVGSAQGIRAFRMRSKDIEPGAGVGDGQAAPGNESPVVR